LGASASCSVAINVIVSADFLSTIAYEEIADSLIIYEFTV
jgi:hypothetical protein